MRFRTRALAVLAIAVSLTTIACGGAALFRQYEYEEEMYLALDPSPSARVDRDRIRDYFNASGVRVTRVSSSRRSGRRFVHVRLDVDDVRQLARTAPFAWSTYRLDRDGDHYVFEQRIGAAAAPGGNVETVSSAAHWNGSELVAFRLHLPSKIDFHNTKRDIGRGNILAWEQPLAERLRGAPLTLEARMQSQSILYRTLWLFGVTFIAVAAAFAVVLWWLLRGRGGAGRAGGAGTAGAAAVLAIAVAAPLGWTVHSQTPQRPIVVELFTSEGCSSCPPADTLLKALVDGPPVKDVQIIALGEHVDYWDQLGWKDRFSSAALTNRQRVYAASLGTEVYTPQMVVDGQTVFVGSDAAAARRALERAASAAHGQLTIAAAYPAGTAALRVTLTASGLPTAGRGDRADLVVAITEDGLQSNVTRGENHGRTLAHAAVVRHLATVGDAGTTPATTEIPIGSGWRRDRLKVIGFVQERRGRAILASAAAVVPDR
jgi:hypothetical protein